MPVRSDDPLRRVTLNLYEADCAAMEALHGHGWTAEIRYLIHKYVVETTTYHRIRRTLGDLE